MKKELIKQTLSIMTDEMRDYNENEKHETMSPLSFSNWLHKYPVIRIIIRESMMPKIWALTQRFRSVRREILDE